MFFVDITNAYRAYNLGHVRIVKFVTFHSRRANEFLENNIYAFYVDFISIFITGNECVEIMIAF